MTCPTCSKPDGTGCTVQGCSYRFMHADPSGERRVMNDPDCDCCHGAGEFFAHADDCYNDNCGLAGGFDDCQGQVIQCDCRQAPDTQARTLIAFTLQAIGYDGKTAPFTDRADQVEVILKSWKEKE
jgi:hypothetical protein